MNASTKDTSKFVIGVILIAVVLIVGVYILSIMQTTFTSVGSAATYNETLSNFTVAGVSVANSNIFGFGSFSVNLVTNFTGGNTVVPANNYTTTAAGLVKATAGSPFLNQRVNVSYTWTYTATSAAGNASENATIALGAGTNWLNILLTVGFAIIVLVWLSSVQDVKGAAGTKAEVVY